MRFITRRRRRDRVAEILGGHEATEERLRRVLSEHAETLIAYEHVMFPGTRADRFDLCSPIPCDWEDNYQCFRHRVARHG